MSNITQEDIKTLENKIKSNIEFIKYNAISPDEFLYVNKFKCVRKWDDLLAWYKDVIYNVITKHDIHDINLYDSHVKKEAILKEICFILEQELEYKEFLKVINDIEKFVMKKQITSEKLHDIVKYITFTTNFDYENEATLDIISGEIHLKNIKNGKYVCKNNMKLTITNYKKLKAVYYLLLEALVSY